MTEPVDMPYELTRPTAYEWTEKAYDLMLADKLIVTLAVRNGLETTTASGTCPRCDHNVAFTLDRDAPLPGHVGGLGTGSPTIEQEYVPVDVQCRCEGTHPGRPPEVGNGCGILFRAEVVRTTA